MDLRHIENPPKFESTVDAYTLSQFKTEEGRLMAQTLSRFDDGQNWLVERMIELNNFVIEIRSTVEATKPVVASFNDKKAHISQFWSLFLASLSGAVATFVGEYLVSLFHH